MTGRFFVLRGTRCETSVSHDFPAGSVAEELGGNALAGGPRLGNIEGFPSSGSSVRAGGPEGVLR
jgi:hypothetical protein